MEIARHWSDRGRHGEDQLVIDLSPGLCSHEAIEQWMVFLDETRIPMRKVPEKNRVREQKPLSEEQIEKARSFLGVRVLNPLELQHVAGGNEQGAADVAVSS